MPKLCTGGAFKSPRDNLMVGGVPFCSTNNYNNTRGRYVVHLYILLYIICIPIIHARDTMRVVYTYTYTKRYLFF